MTANHTTSRSVPPILYKYCPPCRLEPLRDFTLRITQFNQLNDPLECMPVVLPPGGKAAADAKWKQFAYEEYLLQGGHGTRECREFRGFLRTRIPIRDHLRRMSTEGVEKRWLLDTSQMVQDGMSNFAGIISLSEPPDSLLMLSHYAKEHTGYVIGIDPGQLAADSIGGLAPVLYGKARPKVYADRKTDFAEFFTKSEDWSYEKEWRGIMTLERWNLCVPKGKACVKEFRAEALRELILGFRVLPEVEAEAVRIRKELPWVRIKRARPSALRYSMILEDVE